MPDYQAILTEVNAGVATIWFNRPEHRNTFSAQMTRELHEALDAFEADDDVRVVVVTGAGRYFSAGADLGRGAATFSGQPAAEANGQSAPAATSPAPEHWVSSKPWLMRTPIIAAMNGSAVGMGLTIPMTWDIRIAAAEGKYGFVFPRRGLVPEEGSSWIVPRLIGASRALEILLTGRIFSGTEAAEMGLMTRALPADEVLPAALELARDIAANASPMAVAATKALIYNALDGQDRDAHHAIESAVFRWTGKQADSGEGVMAFLEKRAPTWKLSKTKDFPPQLQKAGD